MKLPAFPGWVALECGEPIIKGDVSICIEDTCNCSFRNPNHPFDFCCFTNKAPSSPIGHGSWAYRRTGPRRIPMNPICSAAAPLP